MAALIRQNRITGVLAPVLTPFDRKLTSDPKRFVAFARVLASLGIGLAPFGTTSEGNSLSVAEKLDLLDALATAGIDMGQVMPGTGTCALPDTVELSRRAVRLGCGGVLMLPPFYYKGMADDGLFRSYSEVIQRVGDKNMRLYLYHFPRQSGVPLSLPLIERLLKAYPGVVAGIKDSSGEFSNMEAMIRAFPGFDVFTGTEALMLKVLRIGGAGCISANANVNGAAMVELFRKWREPEAEGLQEALTAFRVATQDFPLVPLLKTLVARASGDQSWRVTRPPLLDLSIDAEDEAAKRLGKAGFPV
ncbi:dihydrodipicolinate synthase family protein [Magnetospirillum sulfuroxidans]|uniref:Dihydrodipicolinate synthase family protein n=1 Tax=Magnetospirillum sulfuroxidans TaxID=611300 RepID=A0ABS5I9D0_9PROT|nr:dihydrodipicolinate synthase family protein [Magnetospirillum sulfuroxidans]MBR9970343.1 dihydrodipicolinate synthase family protein [Magnetospirillum sulfuroxidans]